MTSRRRAVFRVCVLFGGTALLVVLAKILKFDLVIDPDFLVSYHDETLQNTSNSDLRLYSFLLLVPVGTAVGGLLWTIHRYVVSLSGLRAVAAGTCAVIAAPLAVYGLLPSSLAEYAALIGPSLVACFQTDLMVVLCAWLIGLAVTRLSGTPRVVGWGVLYVFAALLVLIPFAELAYVNARGLRMEWDLVRRVLFDFGAFAPTISAGIGTKETLALLTPIVPIVLAEIARWFPAPRWTPRPGPAALGLAIPIGALLLLPNGPVIFEKQRSAYAGISQAFVSSGQSAPVHYADVEAGPPPFETDGICLASTDSTRRHNVVMILLESVNRRNTTPYNDTLRTTPFLDSLARDGLRVEQMYAEVPQTLESLVSLLGGIPSISPLRFDQGAPSALPTSALPELLDPLGYRSAFFSASLIDYQGEPLLLEDLGFDTYKGRDALPANGFEEVNPYGFEDRVLLDPALHWADSTARAGHPFLLTLLTNTTHYPYTVPEGFQKKDYGSGTDRRNDYHNAIRYTDDFLRDVFAQFDRKGLLDETIFIVAGDHGDGLREGWNEPIRHVGYQRSLAVPMILYGSALPETGKTIKGVRRQVDVLPTIADLLNVQIKNARLPGRSLLTPPRKDGRTLYYQSPHGRDAMALRRDSLKYVYRFRGPPPKVFDVKNAPLERENIADRFSDRHLQAIKEELLGWRKAVEQSYASNSGANGSSSPPVRRVQQTRRDSACAPGSLGREAQRYP